MIILAIDTSGLPASTALVDEKRTIAEFSTNFQKTHSETLMPIIDKMMSLTGISLGDIDYIACASGPGSFTGLRIGVACAKGLAFGGGQKIVGVPTLDALAYNVIDGSRLIVPIMDARRSQVYTASYRFDGRNLKRLSDYSALSLEQLAELLSKTLEAEHLQGVLFTGDGINVYSDKIKAFPFETELAPPHLNMQRASSVGALALEIAENASIPAAEFVPFYLRAPQAERSRLEKLQNMNI